MTLLRPHKLKAESAAKLLENLSVGMKVKIERERGRMTKILEGKIVEILDKAPHNEKGILVKLEKNYVGNVKEIQSGKEQISITKLRELIDAHESRKFEMKSSFKYDVNISKHLGEPTKNDALKRVIAEEAASFMNTDGGIICIGVDDEKNILGLENDYKLQSDYTLESDKSTLRDNLRLEIKQTFIDYFEDERHFGLPYTEIIELEGKDLCCITIKKSPNPIFVKIKTTYKLDGKDKKGEIWKCYIRYDNGIREMKFDSFMDYWKNRDDQF